ncbi:MAG TPA: helix-turn-helix domain-containing protein, partial [Pseudonocardiaceae bacterium]
RISNFGNSTSSGLRGGIMGDRRGGQAESRPDRLWSPSDLSAFLIIPEKTLREWRYKGYGPPWRKLGKHVRYEPDAVKSWFDQLTSEADVA